MLNKVLIFGTLFFLLVSCQNVSNPSPITNEETPISSNQVSLFNDRDIDSATTLSTKSPRLIEPTDLGEIADGATLPDLPDIEVGDDDSELSNQAVLPGVLGIVYYIQYDPSLPEPYSVYKHDQSSNLADPILVYEGQREIQSVAGDLSGNVVFLSMRWNNGWSNDFQILRLNLLSGTVQDMTFSLNDNINVSVSRDGTIAAFERQYNGDNKISIYKFESATSNTYEYTNFTNYRDPSISSNGRYLVAVRDLNNGKDRIYKIDLADNTRKTVATSSQLLEDPSISDDGDRVLWLHHANSNKRARVKTLSTNTTQNVYTHPNTIEHPFITADGNYMTFGRKRKGDINVYTKDLELGTTRRLSTREDLGNQLAMTWAQTSKFVTNNSDSGLGSLRQAIADAKSGDVIAFDTLGAFATPQEIILESQIDIDKDLIIEGTGAENLKLLVNSSANTRAFRIHPDVNVVLDSMTITGGEAQDSGSEGGNLELGGGIYNEGILTLQDSTIIDNKADRGGGIYNSSLGTLTVLQSQVLDNFNSTLGGGIYNEGILTLQDSTIIDNKATRGGGIYNSSFGTLTVLQSQILDNINAQYGGGIYNKGNVTIIDSAIDNNHSFIDGGGIFNDVGSSLSVHQSQIENNGSGNSGGGIANKGNLNILESTITSNRADVDTIDGEHAYGGAIYSRSGSVNISDSTIGGSNEAPKGAGIAIIEGTLTMSASFVSDNSSRLFGGGIYNGENGSVTIEQSYIQGNLSTSSHGGGIYNLGNFTLQDNSHVIDNRTVLNGGGIYSQGIFTIKSSSVENNEAEQNGAGIYTNSLLQVLDNSQVSGNNALALGGGIHIDEDGEAIINDSTIGGTVATDANAAPNGGGISNLGTLIIHSSGKVIGNTASSGAGGIYNLGTLNNQGTVANNTPDDIVPTP